MTPIDLIVYLIFYYYIVAFKRFTDENKATIQGTNSNEDKS